MLLATEQRLHAIARAVAAGRLKKGVAIAERVGRAWGAQRMRKHFRTEIDDGVFRFERDEKGITREASLDGFYVIRTSVQDARSYPADEVVRSYKCLSRVEHVFRNMKTTQLLVRPIYHYNEHRVRAHIFLCMLAAHVLWHLERRLADLLFHDPDLDELKRTSDPAAPTRRSEEGVRKDREHTSADDYPLHSLKTLLAAMGTLQRLTMRVANVQGAPTWDQLSVPSPHQRRVFDDAGVRLM